MLKIVKVVINPNKENKLYSNLNSNNLKSKLKDKIQK